MTWRELEYSDEVSEQMGRAHLSCIVTSIVLGVGAVVVLCMVAYLSWRFLGG